MNLAQRIVEAGEAPRDAYELAGCARFTPRREDVVAGLQRLAAENAPFVAHWNKETRHKGQQLQRQIDAALNIFATPEQQLRHDEALLKSLRQAYQSQMAGQSSEALKRWLRLTQNVHSSRIDTLARKLIEDKFAETPVAPVSTPAPTAAQVVDPPSAPQPAPASTPKPPTRRPPKRPGQPDYFALPWIVGSAAVTAVICLALLLYFFRDRFGGQANAIAQVPPGETAPLEAPGEIVPGETTEESAPLELPSEPPAPQPPPVVEPNPPATKEPTTPTSAPMTTEPTAAPTTNPATNPAPPANQPSTTNSTPATTTPAPMPMPVPPPAAGARQTIEFGRAIHSLAWDSSGKLLALAGEGGDVVIWDTSTGAEARRLQDSFSSATSVAFNGRSVGVATADNRVIVWNAFSGNLEHTLKHADLIDPRTLAWVPNTAGGQVVIGDGAGAIRTYSLSNSNPVSAIELGADAGAVQALTVSTKRQHAVSAHLDGTVVLWSLSGKAALKCLLNPESSFLKAVQKPAAASSKTAELSFCGHEICYDVDLSPDETLLATAATDLELWELDSARHLIRQRVLPGVPGAKAYRVVRFSADGSLLATGNAEGTLCIIDVKTWTVVVQEKFPGAVLCLNWYGSDSRRLAVGLENGQAIVMPLGKNVSSLKATPDFDTEKLLAKTKELVEDEEWYAAARLMAVLTAFPLPVATRSEVDRLRGQARKGVQAIFDELDEQAAEDPDAALFDLQLAIDIDPLGKLAKDARAKLKNFPARTPATLLKAAAAENAEEKAAEKKNTTPAPKAKRRFGRP